MSRYVMSLDEGSTSARTLIVDEHGGVVAEARSPMTLIADTAGGVELDAMELLEAQVSSMREALARSGLQASDIAAIGITNQRETTIMWNRHTGVPVHNAIMWMSKQSEPICREWSALGLDQEIRRRTGLMNDSYFSASKIAWLMRHVPGVAEIAASGDLLVGTVDTWLLWKLTGGRSHRTDHSNAARTMLFNVETLDWDPFLCEAFHVPRAMLPEAVASDSHFGDLDPSWLGASIPITGILADQQSGLFGQACFEPGAAKNTFGTAGVFTALAGERPLYIDGLTTGPAWSIGDTTTHGVEGLVFHGGQTIQWLRDNVGLITDSAQTADSAARVPDTGGVYFVPAFTGLCSPFWDRSAKGSIIGLTLATTRDHIVRAALESLAYQAKDNVEAFLAGKSGGLTSLKVDGGAAVNDPLCQFTADIIGFPVQRPVGLERTGLGVAYMAGFRTGVWSGPKDLAADWALDRVFEPAMSADQRESLYAGWLEAVGMSRAGRR